MDNDASTDKDFFARLGIERAPKAKSIKKNVAENAQRVTDGQALLARLDMTAIKTRAKAL